MINPPPGSIAVLFISGRNALDADGYDEASEAMVNAAAAMDGYLGIASVRDDHGIGITVSWWRDEPAALAWRDDPDHTRIRDRGRAIWYDWYRVVITTVDRSYNWCRSQADPGDALQS